MITNEEKIEILKEHFLNDKGVISLKGLDLGESVIDLSNIKAKVINNSSQIGSKMVDNSKQESNLISNQYQKSNYIYNNCQKSKELINNLLQKSKKK